ncbi:kinesin-like protein KIN-12B isoform X2 [Brassica napus]|uniref:Kinesin motor domain-containing protein n=1 Tax=Brassica oleracea var. oleracea TaxID=109376 RepID=A0A0D3AB35_BRAOL|nr:PREDICTED: kinesin-like protein KIN12B isoform X2 [Brassica oleracea var. oleracea]XP_048601652.1 kinesin-like protein KIN-12B isoform X2 [Brassica napus]
MKHFMMPRNAVVRDIGEPQSPNPSLTKSKSQRKTRSAKENAPPPDPNSLPPDYRSSPAKLKSPLPPRPPSANPLKRKLIAEAASDNGVAGVSDSGVKVIVRVKPPSKGEEEEMIVKKISSDALTINDHTFTFDSIADPDSTQDEIFQLVGAPLVENCLAGFNSSVFAYGQTGSGKTYTMWGPANGLLEEHLIGDQRGLTPRVFELLFARISEEQVKHAERQLSYQCRCSFLEIYNEQITDLLDPSQKNLMIREDVKSGVYVEYLTEENVKNLKDLSGLLIKGLANRRTGATSVNAESSRSHCVFTCVVESHCKSAADGLSNFKTSRINLVDLAGSERQKSTGAAGERLKEAGNINRSLSQLGNLINILAEISQTGKQRHIPYRDSRLTFLLQESLGGNAKLAMVCAVSPSQSCRSETFSTLRFAQRAKAIQNKAVVNEVMQDDVNFLREVIRQLREELQRVKNNGNNPANPNAAYATSWNARRSMSLLRSFGLSHPKSLANGDDDGDTEMEIDEEAVERLCAQIGLQSSPPAEENNPDTSRVEKINPSLHTVALEDENYENSHLQSSDGQSTGKQFPENTDVNMEDASCQTENHEAVTINNEPTVEETGITAAVQTMDHGSSVLPHLITNSLGSPISDTDHDNSLGKAENIPSCQDLVPGALASSIASVADASDDTEHFSIIPASPCLSIDPASASHVLITPTESVSPRIRNSRKSLRTSSMSTASQKYIERANQVTTEIVEPSSAVSTEMLNLPSALSTQKSGAFPVPTNQLAASLHRGMKILDSYRQSTAQRRSTFGFSYKALECKPSTVLSKADVGVQTYPEADIIAEENPKEVVCIKCKCIAECDVQETSDISNRQSVTVDNSEKSSFQVPKAVEKVLAGSIRREMALEEYCTKQASEISQLNRLVQQYKHERECNAIIGQTREDKIVRLEGLMDGVLSKDDFLDEEFASLMHEHKLLKDMYENHPEVLQTRIELKRAQEELESFKNFYGEMGEREVLLEEIQDLKAHVHCYTDTSLTSSRKRGSLLKLTYTCDPNPAPPLNAIPESVEESPEKTLEQERLRWTEAERNWISLAEELKNELDTNRKLMEKQKRELDTEKRCTEELTEAMQMAMKGHARMIEQYADLEEKHIQLLARHRRIREGIDDVKKAAARAGVKGAESRFINALAAEISALKVQREKEAQYFRDENKSLQSQLRDTAEAVEAAGELLARLKEAEEGLKIAQKRATDAEYQASEAYKQIEKLKSKQETGISTLNQQQHIAESHNHIESLQASLHGDDMAKYDEPVEEPSASSGDEQWREEFEPFYKKDAELAKLAEPSWFSGYDRCNI